MDVETSLEKTDSVVIEQNKGIDYKLFGHENAPTFGEGIPELKTDPKELFKRSILDQTKDYPPPSPLLYFVQNGERFPHRTKKSFTLQQGKQKSKKTTELALEVASYISQTPSDDETRFECAETGIVIFFDCEQGESYAARTMKLILKIAGVSTCDRLLYCDLREFTPTERLEIIEAAIEMTVNIKWVIVDGLVDVMNDFMSAEEAHTLITFLLRLCSKFDIHVTGVLHQNKGLSKDARAHVGSIAGQKCEAEIMVEKDPNDSCLSIVSAKESRGLPFEDFAIRWDKGELPKIVQGFSRETSEAAKKEKPMLPGSIDITTHKEILAKVLKIEKSPKLKDFELGLQNEISSWYGFRVTQATVQNYRKFYIDNELIKTEGLRPHTRYLLNQ
jgi:hypothetical protein